MLQVASLQGIPITGVVNLDLIEGEKKRMASMKLHFSQVVMILGSLVRQKCPKFQVDRLIVRMR